MLKVNVPVSWRYFDITFTLTASVSVGLFIAKVIPSIRTENLKKNKNEKIKINPACVLSLSPFKKDVWWWAEECVRHPELLLFFLVLPESLQHFFFFFFALSAEDYTQITDTPLSSHAGTLIK